MIKKIIAIDIDDVLADTTESLRMVVNKKVGSNLTKEHYLVEGEYWGYYESVWKKHGLGDKLTFEEIRNELTMLDQTQIEVMAGAGQAVKTLSAKFDLIALTSRPSDWKQLSIDWVNMYFPEMFTKIEFVHHDDKDVRTKGEVCEDLGASWLVDDSVDYCISALEKGLEVILFGDYGWNMHRKIPKNMKRAKNWHEVLEYFENAG